jgi:hypothetical protein
MLKKLQRLPEFGYVLLNVPLVTMYVDNIFLGSYDIDQPNEIFKKNNYKIPLEKLRNAKYVRQCFSVDIAPTHEKASVITDKKYKYLDKKDVFLDILVADLGNLLEKKFTKAYISYLGAFYNYGNEKELVTRFRDNRTFKKGVILAFEEKIYYKKYF